MLAIDANVWVAAFDPRDRFHDTSVTFLRAVAVRKMVFHAPALLVLEVACALAGRAGSADVGAAASRQLQRHPLLQLHSIDAGLLGVAAEVGTRRLLRGADALYAAVAQMQEVPLVSWDQDLMQRAGAMTPVAWLNHR